MKWTYSSSQRRRGMSLVEISISVATFAVVGIFVAAITLAVGRESRDTISTVPAEQQAYRAMDFIRRELLPSTVGTVTVSNDGSTITFRNPSRPSSSRIEFDADKRVCIFIPDVNASQNSREYGRNITGSFTRLDPRGTRFRVEVNALATNRKNEPIMISYRDDLTIRN